MKYRILVLGRHEDILATILRLINNMEGLEATGTTDDEEAIELFYRHQYDLVLVGGGISSTSEKRLKKLFSLHTPGIKMIQHFGGGGGLLQNEIRYALEGNAGNGVNVADNPFS